MTVKAIKIVAVSGDPGGAEALAPVLAALEANNAVAKAYAYRQAQAVWTARGLSYTALSEQTDEVACANILRQDQPDLLLISTSVNGVNLERKFTSAAKSSGIPSLAVLDMWSNYRSRFSNESGDLAFLADRVAVMDERARTEMVAEGIAEVRLVVTGQPAFEEIASWKKAAPSDLRQTVRSALEISETDLFVVFGSQPISSLLGSDPSAPNHIGYTERTVILLLTEALENIGNALQRQITLLIRPHPREVADSFTWMPVSKMKILVSSRFHRREIALAADVVSGMNSAFLIESSCLGCPTVSLQPGLRQHDTLPAGGFGFIHTIYDAIEIQPVLQQLLINKPSVQPSPESTQAPSAEDNILTLIRGMILSGKTNLCL